MVNGQQIQPIFVLPEGTLRSMGKAAQKANIAAGRAVADAIRTTLGPKGMDKMLVSSTGDIVITNDGVTILEEMDIENPAAKMVVEVAKVQEAEVGDGTTTAVVLAGELLKNAEELLEKNIHPTVICDGYKKSAEKAIKILEEIGEKITKSEKDKMKNIAITAMTGKNVYGSYEKLAKIAVDAVLHVADGSQIDIENIKIEKKEGNGIGETSLIKGIVLDKEKIHPGMPSKVENAKIALLDAAIEVKDTEADAKIQVSDPMQLQAFIEQEDKMLRDMVNQIASSGANVVFCQKGIDDVAQHYLAKKKIYAVRRVTKSDMEKLARATNGCIVSKIKDLSRADLGGAGLVRGERLGGEEMTFVEECTNPKAVSVIARGGTEHVVAEVERALKDAIGDLAVALSNGRCVAGGGAIEIELSRRLREYADKLAGREQLAARAFADTFEIIPRTLAENAGLDPIDILAELKAAHEKKNKWAGVDVFEGKVVDMWKRGVIEPLKIKTQAISSASDAAIMLLRVDDIVSATKSSGLPMPTQRGMPGGMEGMY